MPQRWVVMYGFNGGTSVERVFGRAKIKQHPLKYICFKLASKIMVNYNKWEWRNFPPLTFLSLWVPHHYTIKDFLPIIPLSSLSLLLLEPNRRDSFCTLPKTSQRLKTKLSAVATSDSYDAAVYLEHPMCLWRRSLRNTDYSTNSN
jgi:hypothetical protein